MSQLSSPSPSFRRHSSPGLPRGRFGSLYRFNGSSGIQTRKGTPTRKTDGQTETERQRTRSERNRGKKREKTEGALFYRRERGELRGAKGKGMKGEKDRSHHARGRGGVWSNLLRGLVSPGFIFHKLFTQLCAHTQNEDSSASHSFVSIGPHPIEESEPGDFLTTYRRS